MSSNETFRIGASRIPLNPATAGEWTYESRPGGWIVATRTQDGARFRFQAVEAAGRLGLAAGGRLYDGTIEQPKRGGAGGSAGDADLVAQFPGKVRKLLVQPGDAVEEGQPLLLVEAMKMEFTIRSPHTGSVKRVNVTEGQQLTPGTRFLDIEEAKK